MGNTRGGVGVGCIRKGWDGQWVTAGRVRGGGDGRGEGERGEGTGLLMDGPHDCHHPRDKQAAVFDHRGLIYP